MVAVASLAAFAQAGAQDCFPARSSNEAEVFAIFSVPLAFSPAGAPGRLGPGVLAAGLELAVLPRVDSATRTPLTCRPGKGPENTNLLPALPRPRVALGLPGGFVIEASWIPPLRVAGVKANLVSGAIGYSLPLGSAQVLTLRGHATVGTVTAPITCDDDALRDPESECFDGQRSDDTYKPNIFGAELAVAFREHARLRPYLGLGYNAMRPRFQVNFTNRVGDTDRNRVSVNLARGVVFGGFSWHTGSGTVLGAELYAAPEDAVTARVLVRRAFSAP